MTDSSKTRRRLAFAIVVIGLLALIVALIPFRQQRHRRRVVPRYAGVYRERYTPKAHRAEPGTIGILITFAPTIPLPDGGWKVDTQLSIEAAAGWLRDPALPFQLDQKFGAIGVTLPIPMTPTARPAGSFVAAPNAAAQPPAMQLQPHRVGTFAARGTVKVSDL